MRASSSNVRGRTNALLVTGRPPSRWLRRRRRSKLPHFERRLRPERLQEVTWRIMGTGLAFRTRPVHRCGNGQYPSLGRDSRRKLGRSMKTNNSSSIVERMVIPHTAFAEARQRIEQCFACSAAKAVAEGLAIVGES